MNKNKNFYKNRNKKSNFTQREIAQKLNTSVDKIKALENNELEINSNTFENYIDVTNTTKAEKQLEYAKLLEWYNTTDLKELRLKFNYEKQKDLCNAADLETSSYSLMENKKSNKPSYALLYKLYTFFNDDFNKKIDTRKKCIEINDCPKVLNEDIIFNLDWDKLIKNAGKQRDLSKEIGINQSVISTIKNKKTLSIKYLTRKKISNYLYSINYIDENGVIISEQENKNQLNVSIDNSSKIIEEPSIDLTNDFEEHNSTITQFEEEKSIVQEPTISEMFEWLKSHNDCEKLIEENILLKQKINRYEKILDKILG